VQLINATGSNVVEALQATPLQRQQPPIENRFWQKMDRSLGNKRKKIAENGNERGIGFITQLYGNFEENEFVKIYPNKFFGYWRITVEQPLKDLPDGKAGNGKVVKSKGQPALPAGRPKPDPSLRDYENIPFLKKDTDGKLVPQTIEEYFNREVIPHLPEAWINHTKTKTGYEINFTKYFYEFKPLRPLAEIKADILALEEKTLIAKKTILD
jgi:type I restriction enzyme M protein